MVPCNTNLKGDKVENNSLKLSDAAINQIQICLQMAILTGTDIVDHFRMLRLVEENGELDLDPKYTKTFKENVDKMLAEVQDLQAAQGDFNLE